MIVIDLCPVCKEGPRQRFSGLCKECWDKSRPVVSDQPTIRCKEMG